MLTGYRGEDGMLDPLPLGKQRSRASCSSFSAWDDIQMNRFQRALDPCGRHAREFRAVPFLKMSDQQVT
jgi:hypothetical protein